MPMKRGNRVALLDPSGQRDWLEGRVGSRTTNGWLRVRVRGRGDLIVVRNSPSLVARLQELPLPHQAVTTIARFTRRMLARNAYKKHVAMMVPPPPSDADFPWMPWCRPPANAADANIIAPQPAVDKSTNELREHELIEEINSEDEEVHVVDPPDDAYASLTTEQQQAVRRLIGKFMKVNMSTESRQEQADVPTIFGGCQKALERADALIAKAHWEYMAAIEQGRASRGDWWRAQPCPTNRCPSSDSDSE